jgi:hypothetical protein
MSIKTLAIAISALALTAGAASAQMSSGSMSSGDKMSSMKMSKSMMKTQKMCAGMTKDKMMMSSKCKSMAAAHPEMMNSDGTMMMPH